MEICLVRHGIAVERGAPEYADDATRPLTAPGRVRMEEAAAGLKRLFTPQMVLTSPMVRAAETAEILRKAYGLGKVRICEGLATGDHAAVLAALEEADAGSVALVGHEPWTSELLSYLLTGERSGMASVFKKGAAALVRCPADPAPGNCWLEWLVQPGALRRLGQAGG
ncbi:MAG: phosphohistidine phosphatase SixA [Dehalococcoidia bacterium]|nr:phosphohistidine phosphatase SixA [Dehalococcoidia bacterium]